MKIYDGREAFSQWDRGVMLTSPDLKLGEEVHITNCRRPNAMSVYAHNYNGYVVVDVPNILLQTIYPILVFRYVDDGKSGYTVEKYEFSVNQKQKPDNYVYTETEILTIESAVDNALLNAKESGEFDGEDGKDGNDGVSTSHEWNGTVLTVTSASGTSSADLKGERGEKGDKGDRGNNLFEDEVTGEQYMLYVSNGKLMMKKVEE